MDETPIELVEHDPAWAERFAAERDRLRGVIGAHTHRIDHVGSTSVPGLAAKPIVDVTAVVSDAAGLLGDLDGLATYLGYEVSHVPGDWLLLQRSHDGQAYNLHLVDRGDETWRHDLLFREYLRANPDAREEYEATKRAAAGNNRHDIDGYNAAKGAVCERILDRAMVDDAVTIPDPDGSGEDDPT